MKRGIEKATLISLMILLVTVVVLWPVLSQAAVWMQSYADGGMCQASVAMASLKIDKLCFGEVASPTALNCPRRHIEIKEEATLVYKDEKSVIVEDLNDAAVETLMLEELRECWSKFGEGKLPVFPEVPSQWWGTDKTGCHICSEMHFHENSELDGVSLQERLDKPMPGSEESYREYLNNPNVLCEDEFGEDCWTNMEEKFLPNKNVSKMDVINPEKTYAAVMVRKRFDECTKVDDPDVSNFAYIVAHDELENLCTHVIS